MRGLMALSFALATFSSASLRASDSVPAQAAPAATPDKPEAIVDKELVRPLEQKHNRVGKLPSRAEPFPEALRVRIDDARQRKDKAGGTFVTFAVEACGFLCSREGEKPEPDYLTGCVYPETHEVFVRRGHVYFPALVMLGKRAKRAADHVCQGEPPNT